MREKITTFLNQKINNKEILFLAVALLIFSLFRVPSVVEPYWYGDEGIYEVIGQAVAHGRMLYSGIWDNKPPLLYMIYALFSGDQFYVRLLSIITGMAAIVFFFLLAKKLFKKELPVYISTIFFAIVFGLPLLEGNIANAENFMLLPIIAGFYCILQGRGKNKYILIALSGVLLSLAFLTKIVAVFDFAAIAVSVFILRFYEEIQFTEKKVSEELKKLIAGFEQETVFAIFFAIPIVITAAYFFFSGAFSDFFHAALSQNVGYVGYGNYFLFPMGLLFFKLVILLFSTLLVARYRRALGQGGVVILVWVLFSLFNAFFSARPYTHYVLVLLPALSLLLGYIFEYKRMLKITLPFFIIILFLVHYNFNFYTKIVPYYSNYLKFIGGGSVTQYQSFFDKNTPRDYDIASFIEMKTNPNEGIFLWSDSAQIYALSEKLPPGRYAVSYHITFYKDAIDETKKALDSTKPKYIISTKESPELENFLTGYILKYKIDNALVYERQS